LACLTWSTSYFFDTRYNIIIYFHLCMHRHPKWYFVFEVCQLYLCMLFTCSSCMLNILLISFYSFPHPNQFMQKFRIFSLCTFFILLLLSFTKVQIPSQHCSQEPSVCVTDTVAKQQLCKQAVVQRPLLRNSSVNIFFHGNESTLNIGRDVFCAVRAGAV
jgi:hypothetical protein